MKIDGQQQWVRRRDLGPGQTTAGDMLQNANEHSKKLVLGKHTEAFNKLTGKGGKYEKNPQGAVRELLGNGLPPGSTPPRPTRGPKPKPPARAPKAPAKAKPKAASKSPEPSKLTPLEQMSNAELVKELETTYDLPVPQGLRDDRSVLLQELADRRGVPVTAKELKQVDDILDEFKDVAPNAPRKVAQSPYSKLNKEFDAAEIELGKGGSGEVRLTKDGYVIKNGRIGEFEAQAMKRLDGTGVSPRLLDYEDMELEFKAGAGPDADRTPYVVGRFDGLIKMTKAKGLPLETWRAEQGIARVEDVRDAFLQASKKMHLKGVAHNDRHDLNFFVSEGKGKLSGSFVDYGLAQTDPRAALIEAMGNSNYKRDFQVEQIGTAVAKETSPSWVKFQSNLKEVEEILGSSPKTSQFSRLTVRTSVETLDKYLTEEEALNLLERLYQGV
jgi:hypothetical protein